MADGAIGREIAGLSELLQPLLRFVQDSTWARRQHEPGICDMTFGNPHEPPVAGFAEALARWSQPRRVDWFAYTMSDPAAVATLAASLRAWRGVAYEEADICLTNGAFGGLAACLRAVVDAGDEVIYVSPPWFFYPPMIATLGARPVRVPIQPDDFDLDLAAIEAAITPRTRAIIVNSPHNPTGKIYGPATLTRLAAILTAASQRHGRPIYLLSDEAYSRIVFDGRPFVSPTTFYPHSFLIYTYGKVLLTPGQRLGFVALPPKMPDRESVRGALLVAQTLTGWAFPNALLQHALAEIDRLSIDIGRLQARRDRLAAALRAAGYELRLPEGTFYLLLRAPGGDDARFCELLAEESVFVMPGAIFDLPGYFRISLTASDEMIEQATPAFERAISRANVVTGD